MRKKKLIELERLSPAKYKNLSKIPLVLVLDNLRSALNVGSAFRTADAFMVQKIWLCGITAQPPHREILKTAIGATATVDWQYATTTQEAVRALKDDGFSIYAVEQTTASTMLQDFKAPEKVALIFGNEVQGVNEDILPLCDGAIEIPQFGTKHSLNISVCLGILSWEMIRQLKLDNG